MVSTVYRGSVKNVLGPVAVEGAGEVRHAVFEYTDAFSVFDWGRMPDALSRKGEALAVLAAHWLGEVAKPETWREFSRAPEALALRKGNAFGAVFNEIGERLQAQGLPTHYAGLLPAAEVERIQELTGARARPVGLEGLKAPSKFLLVRQVSVVKPELTSVLGRSVPDYRPTREAAAPRLVPLEVVFRFGCPAGSSLLERTSRDPEYLAQLGFAGFEAVAGRQWDFPVLELFTKLESTDRPVPLSEALMLSGLTGAQLQDLLLKTAWVAGYLRACCARVGLELADGKLEWGLSENGECFLVDAIGPDELRILSKGGVQLSKEFLRGHYRDTPWYAAIGRAKQQAREKGVTEWKRFVTEGPPALPLAKRELATQLYLALTNALTGRRWFEDAWLLERVIKELR